MIESMLLVYQLNLERLGKAVEDLDQKQMVEQPHGVVNHPAWTMGHLAASSNHLATLLGLESTFPNNWRESVKIGPMPISDVNLFPSKGELLAQLVCQHKRVTRTIVTVEDEVISRPLSNERMQRIFKTVGGFAVSIMTYHEGNHLGQLYAWRRAMGISPSPIL